MSDDPIAPARGGPQFIPRPAGTRLGAEPPWEHLAPADRHLTLAGIERALAECGAPSASALEGTGTRSSAVLAPLYEEDGDVVVVLTRRAQHLRSHRGEVSFPGGGTEADETPVQAALRESAEEVALEPSSVRIIGELDHLQTYTSRSYIVPYVGALPGRPELVANPDEVEKILHVRLDELLEPGVFREELWGQPPLARPLFFFELVGDTVWGATASMLRNLLAICTGGSWR